MNEPKYMIVQTSRSLGNNCYTSTFAVLEDDIPTLEEARRALSIQKSYYEDSDIVIIPYYE